MYTFCWSAKGGSGTTVVAAALAVLSARSRPTMLVDLGGDLPAALGVAEPGGPGVGDWLASPHAPGERLVALGVEIADDLQLVGAGSLDAEIDGVQAERLAMAFGRTDVDVVVDAGRHAHHAVLHACAGRSLTIVRPCYLALRRALQTPGLASAAVVVRDRERAYSAADVSRVLGLPLAAEVPWDPAVARSVDAGQLLARLPVALARSLGAIAAPVSP